MKTTKFLFLSLLASNFLFSQQRDCEWFLCNSFEEISSFYVLNDKVEFGSTSFYFTEINKKLKTILFNSSKGLNLHLVFGKDDFIIEGELFINNKTFVKNSTSIELNPRPYTLKTTFTIRLLIGFLNTQKNRSYGKSKRRSHLQSNFY